MTSVTIGEAKKQLSKLIEQAERGEAVIITRRNKRVARLVSYVQELPKRGFGSMRGKAWLDESFWEPLPDEELKLWEVGQLALADLTHGRINASSAGGL